MSQDLTVFAETNFRNQCRKFGIKTDDRRRHMYIVGKTGMGKSVLLENLIYSDIISGKGCCYVDPHGDTVEKLINCIPSNRINDVVYFNPADLDNPIALNVLEKVEPKYRHLIASGLVGVFKKLWADSWGPRLEYILRNAILALLDYPDSTLLGINRMLVDKVYNKKVVSRISDPVVRAFWLDEYPKWNERVLQEVISPIQNKVGQFLSTALIRNIVGQVKSSIDMRDIMDNKKILLMNLSKGRIGEDSSGLLGAMMITKIQLAAMSRVDMPEDEREDFYLYVDEFQNFATDSFADILSEARKYHLNLIIAHQYIEQLGEVVKPAVFGNVGTMIVFRVGAADAEELVKEFEPTYTIDDIVNLPKYNIYLKLMIDGVAAAPFSAKTLPPISKNTGNQEKVVHGSRERYSMNRDVVEEKIRRWSMSEEEKMQEKIAKIEEEQSVMPVETEAQVNNKKIDILKGFSDEKIEADEQSQPKIQAAPVQNLPIKNPAARVSASETAAPVANENEEEFVVECNMCGKKTLVKFKPDPKRPVFCKDCLKLYRSMKDRQKNKSDGEPEEKKFEFNSPRINAPRNFNQPRKQLNKPANHNRFQERKSEPATEISLKQAMTQGPRDFRGRRLANNNNETAAKDDKKPKTQDQDKDDHDLKPGQEVKF